MSEDRRPIGYWLKRLDRLIEESFERSLADQGVSRRQWQTLNTLHERPSSPAALADALRPFLTDDAKTEAAVIDGLRARGWVESGSDDLLRLTQADEQAHGTLLRRVGQTRRLLIEGVSQAEYRATIDVLRRMTDNLEHAIDDRR